MLWSRQAGGQSWGPEQLHRAQTVSMGKEAPLFTHGSPVAFAPLGGGDPWSGSFPTVQGTVKQCWEFLHLDSAWCVRSRVRAAWHSHPVGTPTGPSMCFKGVVARCRPEHPAMYAQCSTSLRTVVLVQGQLSTAGCSRSIVICSI